MLGKKWEKGGFITEKDPLKHARNLKIETVNYKACVWSVRRMFGGEFQGTSVQKIRNPGVLERFRLSVRNFEEESPV